MVGAEVTDVAFGHQGGLRWWLAFIVSLGLIGLLTGSLFWVLYEGIGVWGNNIPVTWALDIVSYDWWIGVASGGLLVSALLLLLGAEWRGAINRITETMGLIAAAAAGLYPIVHLGRPWFFYWNLPYPNTFLLWPQFRSPLYWDAVDIISYLLICLCFWYVGMLPDLANMRDRSIERTERMAGRPGHWLRLLRAQLYGIGALGWRGSVIHWQRWERAYRAIAVFGVVLVVSLQTGAAVMFAGSVEPGWHDALLPVAFLFAALFAGVAVVAMLVVVMRAVFPLRDLVTARHLNLLALLLLALGWANVYCYAGGVPDDQPCRNRIRPGGAGPPLRRAACLVHLGDSRVRPSAGAAFLARSAASLRRRAVRRGAAGRVRHVGRPFHGDRRYTAARFPAVSGTPVCDRAGRRRHVPRHHRAVPVSAAAVPPLSADDLHPGHAPAGGRRIGAHWLSRNMRPAPRCGA